MSKKIEQSPPAKLTCSVVSGVLKKDWADMNKETNQRSSTILENIVKDEPQEKENRKTERLRLLFEKEFQSPKPSYEVEHRDENLPPVFRKEEFKKGEFGLNNDESEAERRERIEKYKEERMNFFRNKYKCDNINNNGDDDELIRRIKQKTKLKEHREVEAEATVLRRRSTDKEQDLKMSPTKTSAAFPYSPTRNVPSDWCQKKGSQQDSRVKMDNTQQHESNRNGTR